MGHDGQQYLRVRRINLLAQLAWAYLIAILMAWTTTVAMFSDNARALRLPLAIRVAPFALLIVGTGRHPCGAARGRSRRAADWRHHAGFVVDPGPSVFQSSRSDALRGARLGMGYTLNLGNPSSWLVMIVFAAGIAIPLMLVP